MNRLEKRYKEQVVATAMKELDIENIMVLPKITKISVNSGIGPFRENREQVETFVNELTDLTAQKPYPRRAKKSEAGFKIRQNDIVGYAVTLRGERMWAFLDKLINIALPRVRDFRGLNEDSFDENGNYSLGIKEHVIFPEVNPNTTKGIRGIQITIGFSSKDIEKNKYILKRLGFPFRKDEK